MEFNTNIKVGLTPIWHIDFPDIAICFNNLEIFSGVLTKPRVFEIDKNLASGDHCLEIYFTNKTDGDTIPEKKLDKAVLIDFVKFEDMDVDRTKWAGIYEPDYPNIWYSEQVKQGSTPDKFLKNSTYLGWNGVWRLTFQSPVYTWIHKLENLGWIYNLD
tara:strand:+ start:187 stop:663 length:477 start_codon:yes stop_codon:yes gene_type:complete